MKTWQDQALINYAKERILEFMQKKKFTFYQMYIYLDKDKNSSISSDELKDFLEIQMEMPLDEHMQKVV